MFVECLLSAHLVAAISLYMIQPDHQTFCVRSPFHSNTCTISGKWNVSRVVSKTLIVGVWNFKSHSHFLKVRCGYIPDLWNMLPNIDSNFMSIFNSLFMKVEFRINGGINFYFVCWGYYVVWERHVIITHSHHFVLVFTQRGGVRLKE